MINEILIATGATTVGAVAGAVGHIMMSKVKHTNANVQAEQIKDEAKKEAQHLQREAKVAAKSDLLKMKEGFEQECHTKRNEFSVQENKIKQKEENLEKKVDVIDSRMKNIEKKNSEILIQKTRIEERESEIQDVINKQIKELETVANMTETEAKNILLKKVEGQIQNEAGLLIRNIIDETKEKAERESRKIITNAIQRYASDCTYERTTATIHLPTDEMKGRIIGREGRNIRALEAATGVNILIDDTPEAIVISCFDPIRKEVARQLLERLVGDGRIHPTRIEGLVTKIQKEVEEEAFTAGESAILKTGVHSVPPQIVKLLGRLRFRYSYSQNVLQHSIEAAHFMGMIASELGLDVAKAKRIGLFHDLGKAMDHESEGSHAMLGADMLKKHSEPEDIINAVAAHHEEVEPLNVYAVLIQACDALSASRPGARSATTELYLKRLKDLEDIALSFNGVLSCYALQAGREIRVVVEPTKINEDAAMSMARDICQRIEHDMKYPGQIRVTIVRETRAIEYAK